METVLAWIETLGPWAGVAFVAAYALATVAFVPGSLLTLAAGAIFGVATGTLLVLAGATLGATGAFVLARTVARGFVARRVSGDPRFDAVDRAVGREGAKVVLLLRLSPIFPFTLLNYALGLTRIRPRDYVASSFVGMIPGTLMYVYAGHLAGTAAATATGARAPTPARYALLAVGLLATVALAVLLGRIARNSLKERIE